jgi:Ca2+-binding EF-hand superfamily protein
MVGKSWLMVRGSAAGLLLVLALAAAADSKTDSTGKEPPDPPGTGLYMGQLRALFEAWDLNTDGYLDKEELAKAFRGPSAKPYDYVPETKTDKDKDASKDSSSSKDDSPSKPPAKPDYSQYPDYTFLVQLDQDGDGQISRKEFMSWARDYAVQLKQQADQQAKLLAAEQKLLTTAKIGSAEYKKLEKALKHEQEAFNKLAQNMKSFEKSLQNQLKPKK